MRRVNFIIGPMSKNLLLVRYGRQSPFRGQRLPHAKFLSKWISTTAKKRNNTKSGFSRRISVFLFKFALET